MAYTLIWSDSTDKPNITIAAGSNDKTSTSITLTGKGFQNWGEDQQTTFLHLLENFAKKTAPANPTKGQCWYNTTLSKLMVWDGIQWVGLGGTTTGNAPPSGPKQGDLWWNTTPNMPPSNNSDAAHAGSGLNVYTGTGWTTIFSSLTNMLVTNMQCPVAFIVEYNVMANLYNKVAATPSGTTTANSFGYGQNPVPIATTTMTNAMWVILLDKLKRVALHQNTATSIVNGIETEGFIYEPATSIKRGIVAMTGYRGNGSTITDLLGTYPTTVYAASFISPNRYNTAPASLEAAAPAAGSKSRSSSWVGTVQHDITMTFASSDAMKAYFNSGGKVSIATSIGASPATGVNIGWSQFCANIGTVTLSALGSANTGSIHSITASQDFYSLTTTPVPIFTGSSAGSYSYNAKTLTIRASVVNPTTLLVSVIFTSPDQVSSTTTSSLTLTKASSVYLNDPVTPYPTVVSAGTL